MKIGPIPFAYSNTKGRKAILLAHDLDPLLAGFRKESAQGSEAAPTPRLRTLLQFAERLSLQPGSVEQQHLDALREHGLDDRAISDAVQVVSYFAYINRVADGLGVDLEHDMG